MRTLHVQNNVQRYKKESAEANQKPQFSIRAALGHKKSRPQSGRPHIKFFTILINPLYIVNMKFVVGVAAEVVAILA